MYARNIIEHIQRDSLNVLNLSAESTSLQPSTRSTTSLLLIYLTTTLTESSVSTTRETDNGDEHSTVGPSDATTQNMNGQTSTAKLPMELITSANNTTDTLTSTMFHKQTTAGDISTLVPSDNQHSTVPVSGNHAMTLNCGITPLFLVLLNQIMLLI